MDMGAISGIVLLIGIVGITIWLLWSAFRAEHWAWGWRALCAMVGTFLLLFLLLVAELIRHGIEEARGMPTTICFTNVSQVGRALQMYTGDNDERMPLEGWSEAIVGYVGSRETYTCPVLDQPYGYTMNSLVVGLETFTVDQNSTVFIFDGPGGFESVGGVSEIRYRHYDEYATFGFLDGHTRRLTRKDTPPLIQVESR